MIYRVTHARLQFLPQVPYEYEKAQIRVSYSRFRHSHIHAASAELPKMTSGFGVRRATAEDDATFWTQVIGVHLIACFFACWSGMGWKSWKPSNVCVCVAAQVARSGTNINSTHAREYSAL